MSAEYPSYIQVVSDETHIVVPAGSLWRRHSYNLSFQTRGPRTWLPDTRLPLGGSRPYQVVFLVECPACEKARCARCKPHGRPRLVPVTAPVIVDPAQRWQTRRCVPQTAAELAKERWKVYQATHRKTSPRRGKRRDGRGPIALVRKIRQRQLLLMGDALAATLRDEVIEAQLRDLDALEQAIARRSVRAGRKDASLAG